MMNESRCQAFSQVQCVVRQAMCCADTRRYLKSGTRSRLDQEPETDNDSDAGALVIKIVECVNREAQQNTL